MGILAFVVLVLGRRCDGSLNLRSSDVVNLFTNSVLFHVQQTWVVVCLPPVDPPSFPTCL